MDTRLSTREREWAYRGEPTESRVPVSVDKEWVVESFTDVVRLNSEQVYLPVITPFRDLSRTEDNTFTVHSLQTNLVSPENGYGDTAECVLSVLMNPNIRRGSRSLIAHHIPILEKQIFDSTRHANPVEIVLPTLPFKDQNPLTTRVGPEVIDLGEYLFMAQMRDIVLSVKAAYGPGIRITLLTDGLVYADIFADGDKNGVALYRERMRLLRDQMGLRGSVDIVDMAWVVAQEPTFAKTQEEIHDHLIFLEEENEFVKQAMVSLRHGMLFNIASGYTFDEYAQFTQRKECEYPSELYERLGESSRGFASFLLAMKYLRVVQRAFPNALRATVHPKDAAQLPLHLVNKHSRTFPYNGIPVVSSEKLEETGDYRKATRIVRYYEMLQYETARAVYQTGDTDPLYYLV